VFLSGHYRDKTRPCRILNISDSDGEHTLLVSILKPDNLTVVERASAGVYALQDLRRRPTAQLPDLVIIPWRLPLLSGCEFIQEMKADERLKIIPVVVFTSKMPSEEVQALYSAGASCVIPKGTTLPEFEVSLEALKKFWVEVAVLPRRL
jgi:CheY-like chemotaxis protein